MADALNIASLKRWRADPIQFIEQVLRDPETGDPFELFDAEREFFAHAWHTDASGRLLYPEQCFGAPKKSGKTQIAAIHLLTTTILFGGKFPESFALANDLEQATGRVFQAACRVCEVSPLLARDCKITASRIEFPNIRAVIQAIGSDYASAAGANPVISSFDELWAFTSERSRRLWDEMVPPPTRKIGVRLTTTYAGFSGESTLLEELYRRGLAQPEIAPNLYAGDGLLMAWHHEPIAPWQTQTWVSEMRRSLRKNQFLRMVENRFVHSESSFIDLQWWDECCDPQAHPLLADNVLPVFVGVDASVKRDSTAIVVCAWNREHKRVRVIWHRIFQPSPSDPLDFERTIEKTLRELRRKFRVQQIIYDPYQMAATAQRLLGEGLPMVEFPQTVANLTEIGQCLYELIKGRNIISYADADIRLALSRAVAVEGSRGWKISKERQSHKIDVIIALAMAAHAATTNQNSALETWSKFFTAIGGQPLGPAADAPSSPYFEQARKEYYERLAKDEAAAKELLDKKDEPVA
jgi:phage terminase large subunit-like protein